MREKINTSDYLFNSRALLKMIWPLIFEQFLAIAVGLADSVMVASVGEAAVSAVSLIDTIMVLVINAFTALATGGAIVAGQYLGQKNQEEGCRTAAQLILVSFVVSTSLMTVLYLCKGFILHVVFGEINSDVMTNCDTYLMIVTASIPFLALYGAGAAVHRCMGDSQTPMIISLAMNGLNVVGNAALLYGLNWGIEGAAVPSLISRAFAACWMVYLLRDTSKTLHIRNLSQFRPNHGLIKEILHVGVPYSFENSMFQLGKILVLSLVSRLGTASITANAVGNSVSIFPILAGNAMGYVLSAVTAQCVGAGDYRQVRYYTQKLIIMTYIGNWIMCFLLYLLLPGLISAYQLQLETALLAKQVILYYGVCVMLIWPLSFILPCTLRASSDTAFCMVVSMLSMWVFRVGLSFLLIYKLEIGVLGVWIAMTLDWAVRSLVFLIRYRGIRWQMK